MCSSLHAGNVRQMFGFQFYGKASCNSCNTFISENDEDNSIVHITLSVSMERERERDGRGGKKT